MRIITWNVNSLRLRLPHVSQVLTQYRPSILALQETKVQDKDFPEAEIRALGYQSVYSGQKTFNGVALISQLPLEEVAFEFPGFPDPQKRLLAATVGGVRILNVYVPNGASLVSEKYHYKLSWLAALKEYVKEQLAIYPRLVLVGDFNIAPTDDDVHDPKVWEGKVLVSQRERDALQEILDLGLNDTFRLTVREEKEYSWWDYRAVAFRRNLGLRIDLILASHELAKRYQHCYIDKEPRKLERPSDHTPVIVDFDE